MELAPAPIMSLRGIILFATIGLAGGLLGSGLGWLGAATLANEPPPVGPLRRAPPPAQQPGDPLAGGLFAPHEEPPPGPGDPPAAAGPCAEGWRLVGALLDRQRPERSFAAVHTPDGARLIAPQMSHLGLTLVELAAHRVTLAREDGVRCEVRMSDGEAPAPLALAPAPPNDPVGVERVSSGHYRVDRAALRRAATGSRARVVPYSRGGAMVGVRLFGVRADPLLVAHDAREGDILLAVDGVALTEPGPAFEAYARLRSGAPVRVTLERGGVRQERTLEVAGGESVRR